MAKKALCAALAFLLIPGISGCSNREKRFDATFLELFDTVTEIVAYTESRAEFEELARFIYDSLSEYHRLYNIYESYEGLSNIKTINENAGTSPVKVDKRIIDLLLFGKEMYKLTGGKVNIALGPVLKIWHEYRENGINNPESAKLPGQRELTDAAGHTDIDSIVIDTDNNTVFLEDKDMSLDVGAIAKGYAAECVARLLKENGYNDVLLSVGGNVRALGARDDGTAWEVGIADPFDKARTVNTVSLKDTSLVASGDYQRYYTVNGRRYHHIINPETLMPAEGFTAVSVISESSAVADALSTALFILPLDVGQKLIGGIPNTYAVWVMPDGSVKYSPGFEKITKS